MAGITVRNIGDTQVYVQIVAPKASSPTDGVHIQPHGKVTLATGFTVYRNSLIQNPNVLVQN